MLHSFHYYACYYALICLLHQQQQAASITIIIDGFQTNEWNTRDEYQRLVDQAADLNQPRRDQEQQEQRHNHRQQPLQQQQQEQQQQQQQQQRQRHLLEEEEARVREQAQLILKQRQQIQQQQQQTQDDAPLGGLNFNFNDNTNDNDNEVAIVKPSVQEGPLRSNGRARLRSREVAAKKYCGTEFMDVIDLICDARYYQPKIVEPTIKSRRSSGSRLLPDDARSAPFNAAGLLNDGLTDQQRGDADGGDGGGGSARFRYRHLTHGRPLVRTARQTIEKSECCKRACSVEELKELYCEGLKG